MADAKKVTRAPLQNGPTDYAVLPDGAGRARNLRMGGAFIEVAGPHRRGAPCACSSSWVRNASTATRWSSGRGSARDGRAVRATQAGRFSGGWHPPRARKVQLVVDTRNATRGLPCASTKVVQCGICL